MCRSRRHVIFWLMIALYTVIVMSPLAPIAMRSAYVAHAFTGKCSGDCSICGCSLERRAARTCCCWQKKLREQAHQPHQCKKEGDSRKTVLTCSCPCGGEKQLSMDVSGKFKLLPAQNQDDLSLLYANPTLQNPPLIPVARRDEPPDPPPECIKPAWQKVLSVVFIANGDTDTLLCMALQRAMAHLPGEACIRAPSGHSAQRAVSVSLAWWVYRSAGLFAADTWREICAKLSK